MPCGFAYFTMAVCLLVFLTDLLLLMSDEMGIDVIRMT